MIKAMLILAVAAAFALGGHAQAQVATSPWTASDLNGGFVETSTANIGGFVLSASDQPITMPASNAAMELEITFATASPLPTNEIIFAVWPDLASFAADGVDAEGFALELDPHSFVMIEQNIATAQTGDSINVYRANLTEADIGPNQYGNLVDAVEQNPNNVSTIYGNGEEVTFVSSLEILGDFTLVIKNLSEDILANNFDEGLSYEAKLVATSDSVPQLGDVNQDGTVNFFDISPFIAVLSANAFQAEADCNEDGVVNFFDISAFIGLLSNQ